MRRLVLAIGLLAAGLSVPVTSSSVVAAEADAPHRPAVVEARTIGHSVRGRPILDWTLGAMPAAVDRVIVVVHYLADQVEKYLGEQKRFARWATVPQEQPRGTGDALRTWRQP